MDAAALLRLEETFWRAAGDRERYAANLAADALHVFPELGVMAREAVLEGVAGAPAWDAFTIDLPRVVAIGEDAAALVYTARATRPGRPPYRAAVTSVYRREGPDWQLVLHQQTPIGDAD
jgi:hypothetical protein